MINKTTHRVMHCPCVLEFWLDSEDVSEPKRYVDVGVANACEIHQNIGTPSEIFYEVTIENAAKAATYNYIMNAALPQYKIRDEKRRYESTNDQGVVSTVIEYGGYTLKFPIVFSYDEDRSLIVAFDTDDETFKGMIRDELQSKADSRATRLAHAPENRQEECRDRLAQKIGQVVVV